MSDATIQRALPPRSVPVFVKIALRQFGSYFERAAELQTAMALGLAYLIVVGPVRFLARAGHRNAMRFERKPTSTWTVSRRGPRTLADLKRLF